jgi:hypothetical protein
MRIIGTLSSKIKGRLIKLMGKLADRIHPRNSSGNNTSKM